MSRPKRIRLALLLVTACGGNARDEAPVADPTFSVTGPEDAGTSSGSSDGSDDSSGESGSSGDSDQSADGSTGDDGGDPDYTNIARLQVPAAWATGPGNTWTYDFDAELPPDYEIAREFYLEHPDDYDFLVVYTQGEFDEFFAHAVGVQEDITGIRYGEEPAWSQAEAAGSAGRLQQVSLMNSPKLYPDPAAADILIHETMHRWSAFLGLQGAPSPGFLLGPAGGHWNIHVSTGGPSATGYGELLDTGGGAFRFDVVYPLQISPLELYVAGLIPADEVPPLFYVANATGYEPAVNSWGEVLGPTSYGEDATFTGERVDFTIQDIVASNGPRIPAFGEAPTHFRLAFALVCDDVTACDANDLALVEQQRTAFASQFPAATGGRATVETEL